jgi:hypothetical protein
MSVKSKSNRPICALILCDLSSYSCGSFVHVVISCHLGACMHVHFILLQISFLLLAKTFHEIMIYADMCETCF